MARRSRYYIPGVPLHVIFRGNARQDIFRREGDRHFFWKALLEGTRLRGVAVHAYVFMTNHVHLLATPGSEEALPGLMRSLGARYVHYFNRSHQRTGHLMGERYKALYVHDEPYLLRCMRYIELNPVRAGMVASPDHFGWSSFRANGLGGTDDLVVPHELFLRLGGSADGRGQAYRALFDPREDERVAAHMRKAIESGWAIGDEDFVLWTGQLAGFVSRRRGRPAGWRKYPSLPLAA